MLLPQLLGLNLDPGILRCEAPSWWGGGRLGLEWEGQSRVTLSLPLPDPWNFQPGTQDSLDSGGLP